MLSREGNIAGFIDFGHNIRKDVLIYELAFTFFIYMFHHREAMVKGSRMPLMKIYSEIIKAYHEVYPLQRVEI